MTFLLTFSCYGSRIPGEREGIVSRKFNRHTDPFVELSPKLATAVRERMSQAPYVLDRPRADAVLSAMLSTCEFRGWHAYAIHVRTNHVHAVIESGETPERILNYLKCYASRKLNELRFDRHTTKRWARHGSTRYLNGDDALAAAIRYVADEQGALMAMYRADCQ